jgi:hypothetical protein
LYNVISGLGDGELVLRGIVSMEVLSAGRQGRIADTRLSGWLNRIAVSTGECRGSLRCLLDELTEGNTSYEGLAYGLSRLTRMAIVEGDIGFLDYAALILSLASRSRELSQLTAELMVDYMDSSNIAASELAYHTLWIAVFRHGILPSSVEEKLKLAMYSPSMVVACRVRQLLERQLDAAGIDVSCPRPCLVLASHKGIIDLYFIA